MKRISAIIAFVVLFSTLSYALTTITVRETETAKVRIALYDPDNDSLAVNYTSPLNERGEWKTDYGDAGNYKAKVIVSDGKDTIEEDLLIVVEKKEEKPVIEAFSPQQNAVVMKEGDALEFSITAKDIDKDLLSYTWELEGNQVGKDSSYTFSPGYNDSGLHVLNVEVTDGKTILSKGWLVKVEDTDRKPEFRKIQDVVMNEGQKVTINLDVSDPDGDITSISGKLPSGAKLEGNSFTWIPGYDAVQKSSLSEKGLKKLHLLSRDFVVSFEASSRNFTANQSLTIRVRDVNRAPVISDLGNLSYTEGDLIELKPEAEDPDGDFLTVTYSGWMGSGKYQTTSNDAGIHFVTVKASDGFSDAEKEFKIFVKENDEGPAIGKFEERVFREGEQIRIPVDVRGADASLLSGPTGAVVRGGYFEWIPGYDFALKGEKKGVVATIQADDGLKKAYGDIKMIIHDTNRKPVLTKVEPGKIVGAYAGEPVTFSVEAIDEDGDTLSYFWDFGPFESYEATPSHERIFTTEGSKRAVVIVSDGIEEAEYEWEVEVARKVEPVQRQIPVYQTFLVKG